MAKEKKANNIHEISVKIEGKEWEDALTKAFEKANKNAKIDGFRPGKAPRHIFEKKYGKESLYMDAVDLVLQDKYTKVIEDSKLEPVVQPKVDIKSIDENGVELIFVITTKPEVKLGKYKDLGIKKDVVKVTKKEVEERLEELQKQYAEIVVKDGAIEEGDTAIIDFDGYLDGVQFEGGKGENYPLGIGSHTFIPGFEEQLVGMKSEEEKDINVTFPEDYPAENLKGKEVVFKVKVHEVKTKVLPELDEEFFLDLGMDDVKNKEELLNKLEEEIKAHKEYDAENRHVDEALEMVAKETEVDIPVEFVDAEVERMFNQFEQNIAMQGLKVDQYCEFLKTDIETIKNQMREEAEKRVKYRFVLEQIAEVEKIEISDDEANAEAEEMAKRYEMTTEELLKAFGGLDMIKYDLQMKKAIEIITK
ncbi:MAG: trigger factor [Bacilli bacterium]|nr:trigger factor [Bacilli bacterium]